MRVILAIILSLQSPYGFAADLVVPDEEYVETPQPDEDTVDHEEKLKEAAIDCDCDPKASTYPEKIPVEKIGRVPRRERIETASSQSSFPWMTLLGGAAVGFGAVMLYNAYKNRNKDVNLGPVSPPVSNYPPSYLPPVPPPTLPYQYGYRPPYTPPYLSGGYGYGGGYGQNPYVIRANPTYSAQPFNMGPPPPTLPPVFAGSTMPQYPMYPQQNYFGTQTPMYYPTQNYSGVPYPMG